MSVTDSEARSINSETALTTWCRMTEEVRKNNGTVFFIGNGASAMMASHMAADACKNGRVRCLAFNDPAMMTAVSNDTAYEECFALPLARFSDAGDLLTTISSSGNSPNIIKAIETARHLGLYIVTLSGMKEDNRSKKLGDLNFYIPAETYGVVECSHQMLLHCWLDRYMENYLLIFD